MTFLPMTKGKVHSTDLLGFLRVISFSAFVFGGSTCFAQSELARYISPDTPVLAGMRQVPSDESQDLLWLATKNNAADLAQLVKVTADDPARELDEVIASDSASDSDSLGNHLLLAKGRFDYGEIAAAERAQGAKEMKYRGVSILLLDAPRDSAQGQRWFAVLKHDVAMLGSPAAVVQALDRSIDHAEADARVVARLRNIPRHDAAWSSIAIGSGPVRAHLGGGTAGMEHCLGSTSELVLGIEPGSTIEIDVQTTSDAKHGAAEAATCLSSSILGEGARLVRTAETRADGTTLKTRLSRQDYERWLKGFRKRNADEMLEAMVSAGPERPGK